MRVFPCCDRQSHRASSGGRTRAAAMHAQRRPGPSEWGKASVRNHGADTLQPRGKPCENVIQRRKDQAQNSENRFEMRAKHGIRSSGQGWALSALCCSIGHHTKALWCVTCQCRTAGSVFILRSLVFPFGGIQGGVYPCRSPASPFSYPARMLRILAYSQSNA